jgi:hypothetical protein
LAPKAFFCYFFAALGKKVEDISANICTLTVFWARPNPSSTKNWQYQNALDVFSKPYLEFKRQGYFGVNSL